MYQAFYLGFPKRYLISITGLLWNTVVLTYLLSSSPFHDKTTPAIKKKKKKELKTIPQSEDDQTNII